MNSRILLRDGVSRQAVSNGIRHEIDEINLEECVSVLRSKAAPLLQLKAEEIGSCKLIETRATQAAMLQYSGLYFSSHPAVTTYG